MRCLQCCYFNKVVVCKGSGVFGTVTVWLWSKEWLQKKKSTSFVTTGCFWREFKIDDCYLRQQSCTVVAIDSINDICWCYCVSAYPLWCWCHFPISTAPLAAGYSYAQSPQSWPFYKNIYIIHQSSTVYPVCLVCGFSVMWNKRNKNAEGWKCVSLSRSLYLCQFLSCL